MQQTGKLDNFVSDSILDDHAVREWYTVVHNNGDHIMQSDQNDRHATDNPLAHSRINIRKQFFLFLDGLYTTNVQ